MIRKRDSKIKAITRVITSRMPEFNRRYRKGPSLYFYKRLLTLRRGCPRIGSFLSNNYHLEILYALLVSWDMDSRGAKMKFFDEFKGNLLSCKMTTMCGVQSSARMANTS